MITIDIPEAPKLVRRPDGNWDVVLRDDPKNRMTLAGPVQISQGDWAFVSEATANASACAHYLQQAKIAALKAYAPKIEKMTEDDPWWVADRAAGFKLHD